MKKITKCRICGKILSKLKYKLCRSCSFKEQYKKGIRSNSKENHPNWKGGKPHCIDCGKLLARRHAKRCVKCYLKIRKLHIELFIKLKPKIYCIDCKKPLKYNSLRCYKCNTKFHSGDQNGRWIDGRSYLHYPKEFNKLLRSLILNRDKYLCQYCGMSQKQHFKKYGRSLEIHHKDHNKQNNKTANLVSVCKKCHRAI